MYSVIPLLFGCIWFCKSKKCDLPDDLVYQNRMREIRTTLLACEGFVEPTEENGRHGEEYVRISPNLVKVLLLDLF